MFFEMENNTTENSLYNWQRIPTGDFYTVLQRYSTGHESSFSEEYRRMLQNDSSRDEYWHSYNKDYEYHWREIIEKLGYK